MKRRTLPRRKLTNLPPPPLKIKAAAVSNSRKRHLTTTKAVIRKETVRATEMPAVKAAVAVVTINNTVVAAENLAGAVVVENNFAAAAKEEGEAVVVAAENGVTLNSKVTNIRNNRFRPRKSFMWAICPIQPVSKIWKRSPGSPRKSRPVARNQSG